MAGKLGPRPVAIRIRCPKDLELAQELPIPAVGLGVVRHREQPLRASDPRGVGHPRADGVPLAPPAARRK